MTDPMTWRAPWTDEQVAALSAYQTSGGMHPYTCPHGGAHPPLIPTVEGWRCAGCNYRQDWAHANPPNQTTARARATVPVDPDAIWPCSIVRNRAGVYGVNLDEQEG